MTTVLALGDSFSCGEGVGVRVVPGNTWPALLARALPGGRVVHLAGPGARCRDVREGQLPAVVGRAGEIATLLVGLNDVARAGFAPDRVRDDLLATVHRLRDEGRTVLLGRLHDPTTLLPLPDRVRRLARARVAHVNAVVDEAAADPGVLVLDLSRVAALADPAGMAVDRIHPSAAGHAAIASEAAAVLLGAGWSAAVPGQAALPRPPSQAARLRWAARHGAPYLARHLPDLGAPAVAALAPRLRRV